MRDIKNASSWSCIEILIGLIPLDESAEKTGAFRDFKITLLKGNKNVNGVTEQIECSRAKLVKGNVINSAVSLLFFWFLVSLKKFLSKNEKNFTVWEAFCHPW